jgi:hypothetical protein
LVTTAVRTKNPTLENHITNGLQYPCGPHADSRFCRHSTLVLAFWAYLARRGVWRDAVPSKHSPSLGAALLNDGQTCLRPSTQ